MEKKILKYCRISSLIFSTILVFFLVLAAIETNWDQEWYYLQLNFKENLILQAKNENELQLARSYSPQIRQIIVNELSLTDRCISCHLGYDDPRMHDMKPPFNNHSGANLKIHATEKFGCTVCHGGQGRALEKGSAHAQKDDVHWQYPLLPLTRISSYCGKCHLSLFDTSFTSKNIKKIYDGLEIFQREGCLGCHKARGVGGNLGPDLSNQGAKSKQQYYYEYVVGEKSIVNWLKEHFIEPEKISPGSEMLKYVLPDYELEALITFILGLFKPTYPLEYYSVPVLKEFKSQRNDVHGVKGFTMFCAACHGKQGEGKDYQKNKTGIPTLNNPDFQSVASLDFIDFTLNEGRSFRQMASWSPIRSGLYQRELYRIVNFVRSWRKYGPAFSDVQRNEANLKLGENLYQEYCAFCHGPNGIGDLGPSINNEDFLSLTSKKFLYETLINGRSNTAMPSWSRFSADSLASLIKFIRNWQKITPRKISGNSIQGNAERGQVLFHYLCTRCHGKYGQGGIGTAILNKDFLHSASDFFIVGTIAQGRRHSAMLGWIQDLSDKERLSKQDIQDIVVYMRSTEDTTYDIIFPGMSLGNPSKGKKLFKDLCSECHGTNGKGPKAPALNNQEFLNAASNGYLLATITLGRMGTPMPSWGRGSNRYPKLKSAERLDIVAHIRNWQNLVIKRHMTEEHITKN